MTATTAIPEAVRTGLALSFGSKASRSDSGTAAIISTSLGARERPYLRQAADLRALRSTVSPLRERSTMELTISAMALTRASSSVSPWAWYPPRPGRGSFLGSATAAVAMRGREEKRGGVRERAAGREVKRRKTEGLRGFSRNAATRESAQNFDGEGSPTPARKSDCHSICSPMAAPERRKETGAEVLEKVEEVISAISGAKHVDQVICALHSITVLLFPVDSSLLSGAVDQCYRDQILRAEVPSAEKRDHWWQVFYRGAAFPVLARVLLFDVACNWLACFPFTAQRHVYDVFFTNGLATEVVQTLIPSLSQKNAASPDVNAVLSNIERLLAILLLENDGVLRMAKEFDDSQWESVPKEQLNSVISSVAQLVASIPDKAQPKASSALSAHKFFKQIISQLLLEAEGRDIVACGVGKMFNRADMDSSSHFVGEIFVRICRRGYVDVLMSEVIARILHHIRSLISSSSSPLVPDVVKLHPGSQFWLKMMETMRDPYAVEKMLEQLLRHLATGCVNDVEAYWIIWILFHKLIKNQISVRALFVDKFLLWKIFPVCCLRWIFQFAIFECPPDEDSHTGGCHEGQCLLDTMQPLVMVWSKQEFVQSAPLEQQAYVTAAVGLLLEKMSREELDGSKQVMPSILQGVGCRLESPTDIVRKMASSIALAFSKVIDPKNPLYLDDSLKGETIDWEFGFTDSMKGKMPASHSTGRAINDAKTTSLMPAKIAGDGASIGTDKKPKDKSKILLGPKIINPDEIIDPATLGYETSSDDNASDNASESSDASTDSSLQPYDLSDDDTDLKRKISHLVDVVGALRKTDDADGVERALEVAEKLVRASPDELKYMAGDLVRTLIQVRCSDVAVEGEEDSAEETRQKALVALLVTCPSESLETAHKLLYSPNVDISQRIMILDIMTAAAEELAETKIMKPKYRQNPLISVTSESQPWNLPSSVGPPGAGLWKEVAGTGVPLNLLNHGTENLPNWATHYERELPPKASQIKRGKTRRWSTRSGNVQGNLMEISQNKFPIYAAAFMLPAMQGFDKKTQGIDLLGRDFIVLGKLIHMLGVCMKCTALHPEATVLAPALLDMLRSRAVCRHPEAYVRKAVLFAASSVLIALPPSYVASTLVEGQAEISDGLEWVRKWALHVVESDSDRECYTMAMACLQLHAEMALQASRALESADNTVVSKSVGLPSDLSKGIIKIPRLDVNY
ncbi:telomere length regulation protein TEL2 homolog isoform X2 [Punica granatum]|uniref:Telomere length regulation protein TEL2 homolog isoform X2 n=2 Tax=Punica granatum TaxID=22663 RepID=A0A6P8E5R5_PUNGR|nr:telomere length regulation protein TEL2 homolog isoform X2 [Punica granatum]